MKIVVVESPAKAKTINKYLGPGYEVLASFGHVRDLPAKDGSVDPEHDFKMLWEVDDKSNKRLNDIARAMKGAEKLILATDPDREGEAISWHVLEVLKEKHALKSQPVERVVFNAITKQAVADAMKNPRQIDGALVDAYLARRALDYLVGFTLSPVLWRKLPGARSAGRVQSVALRLVSDRELEIEKFVAREYWSLVAKLATPRNDEFEARLVGADGQKIQRLDIGSGDQAEQFKRDLENAAFTVTSVDAKPAKRHPYAPFTTSTLQQEASRKLGFAPAITMRIAQRLYEGVDIDGDTVGLITYMRTDGVDIAEEAVTSARRVIESNYGREYVPPSPRRYQNKSKNAQEAHEAVRPTDLARLPKDVKKFLDSDQARLYELIWLRTIASQMESAELERTTVDIAAKVGARNLDLRATGTVVKFDGFLTLYTEDQDDRSDDEDANRDSGDPAFHRAAAALFGSLAGQAHGGARHRPALDLRLDPAGAKGPRLCADRQEAACPRGQGPRADRVPGKLLRPLRRVRFHRAPRGRTRPDFEQRAELQGRAARVLEGLRGGDRRHQGFAHRPGDRRARRGAGAASVPAEQGRHRSAQVPELRERPHRSEARPVRRLHRLLELSRMQIHPAAFGRARRQRRRHAQARRGSGDRPGSHGAIGPLRQLPAAR
jgi:DNA topoisomerase I